MILATFYLSNHKKKRFIFKKKVIFFIFCLALIYLHFNVPLI